MAFELTSIGSSLLAIGDGMATGAVLLSYLVLIYMVLAFWQGGNKGTCEELCLQLFLTIGAAGRANWSMRNCVCSIDQLFWGMVDGVIKPGEAQLNQGLVLARC